MKFDNLIMIGDLQSLSLLKDFANSSAGKKVYRFDDIYQAMVTLLNIDYRTITCMVVFMEKYDNDEGKSFLSYCIERNLNVIVIGNCQLKADSIQRYDTLDEFMERNCSKKPIGIGKFQLSNEELDALLQN